MRTRAGAQKTLPPSILTELVPKEEQFALIEYCQIHGLNEETPVNAIIRNFLLEPPSPWWEDLPSRKLALVLGTHSSAISKQKRLLRESGEPSPEVKKGRSSFLGEQQIENVREWLRQRCASKS